MSVPKGSEAPSGGVKEPKKFRAALREAKILVVLALVALGLALHVLASAVNPVVAAFAQLVGVILATSAAVVEIAQKDAKLDRFTTWALRVMLTVGLGLTFGTEIAEAVSVIW